MIKKEITMMENKEKTDEEIHEENEAKVIVI
jgi:hypothetical protein